MVPANQRFRACNVSVEDHISADSTHSNCRSVKAFLMRRPSPVQDQSSESIGIICIVHIILFLNRVAGDQRSVAHHIDRNGHIIHAVNAVADIDADIDREPLISSIPFKHAFGIEGSARNQTGEFIRTHTATNAVVPTLINSGGNMLEQLIPRLMPNSR
jgi:hypothetical protein